MSIPDRPAPPEGPLEAVDVFAHELKLKWKPPADDGGGEIIGYTVEMAPADSDKWKEVPGLATGCSHPVKGLEEGKKYKFRVRAENAYGKSDPLVSLKPVEAKNPFGTNNLLY